jgi:hypothetical protein
MEGISKRSRLRTMAVAALVASGIVLMAMSGSTSATSGSKRSVIRKVSLGIRNSSETPIQAQICPNGHARHPTDNSINPCDQIMHTYVVQPGHRHIVSNSDQVGVIITCAPGSCPDPNDRKTLNFYATNHAIFLPYFIAEGERVHLRDHQFVDRTKHYVHFELRRYPDEARDGENVKLMRIEIKRWPADPHHPCKRRPPGC